MSLSQVKEIISQLPPSELADLADWLEVFQEDAWDRQIARDVKAGRFEAILQCVDAQAEASQTVDRVREEKSWQQDYEKSLYVY